jgi:hypothetical protein
MPAFASGAGASRGSWQTAGGRPRRGRDGRSASCLLFAQRGSTDRALRGACWSSWQARKLLRLSCSEAGSFQDRRNPSHHELCLAIATYEGSSDPIVDRWSGIAGLLIASRRTLSARHSKRGVRQARRMFSPLGLIPPPAPAAFGFRRLQPTRHLRRSTSTNSALCCGFWLYICETTTRVSRVRSQGSKVDPRSECGEYG